MKTKALHRPNTTQGDLILVSARHPLPDDYKPQLSGLMCDHGTGIQMAPTAAKMLDFCLCACAAAGHIKPTSGHRSRVEQRDIYRDSLEKNGEVFTRKYVALPGCSEHETGLAIDLAGVGEQEDEICPSLPFTGVYGHFRAHAADYGFVLRYPKGKTHITGIAYEPWHFRYVGWPHAKLMEERGLVLEEYISLLQGYTRPENALEYQSGKRRVAVFTLRPSEMAEMASMLDATGRLWQASGNNAGGIVVTLWQ